MRKSFGDVVALADATFSVAEGEFVAIVGPSGCGKSTLLRLIAGLLPRSGGILRVNGHDVTGSRRDVAFMFQGPTLLPWLTALDNVMLPRTIGRVNLNTARAEALELLELLGLSAFAYAYPSQLSGGMQQRVALARLLLERAQVLLLDEPFGSLDEFTRERLNLEVLRLHREFSATTVLVTHSIPEAVFMADRIFTMTPHPGRIAGIVEVGFGQDRDISVMRAPEFTDADHYHPSATTGRGRRGSCESVTASRLANSTTPFTRGSLLLEGHETPMADFLETTNGGL